MKRLLLVVLMIFLTGCSSTITFNSNGGSSIEAIKVKKDEIVNKLPQPNLEGYTFDGWYIDEDLKNKINTDIFESNTELYAKWIINEYKLFVQFNDEIISEQTLEYNQNINSIDDLNREGYNFDGWYVDKNLSVEFNISKMPANDLHIYAKMIPNSHTVTFVTNGGSEVNPKEVAFDTILKGTIGNSKLKDATFKGWYFDSKLTLPSINQKMPDYDITLYAKWKTYQTVQTNIAKAKQILINNGCTIDVNNPARCMELSVNGLSVDSELLLSRWNSKTTVFSIGHMYVGHAVWYSYEGEKLTIRYTINNKPAPESEVQDVIDRIPAAIKKLEQIEESLKNAGLLSMDDLEWSN